ncbi:amidohydrolase family protein [Streptomyces sp. SID13726]|uniref:amidohydrolase family protein n=1 Tax=Streptomyces sp. SID13726 TaxID=2706058 RepID=UPI0013B6C304|nr:amidohydrolase family protein [Streptomyces sp. SID13726]NEB02774.1 amidohydrolase [Streptomyces sp. SID13726]
MSSPRALPYPLFDADNHLYETEEALTRYLPKQYEGAIEYVQVRGRTKIAILGQISDYIPNPTFEVVARPGAMEEYFRVGNPDGKSRREIFGEPMRSIPAFREPGPRLELLDELGVQRTLMFPTLASLIEERMRHHPELIHAVIHSLNEWLLETWSFNYEDRILTTPVITLPIVEKAIAELNWAVEHGAKAILVRPAPVPGYGGSRSFALEEFDPFWKRVVETGVLVAMHSSDSGYAKYAADWEGGGAEMLPFKSNAFRQVNEWRPIQDAVAAWVCHGALFRFPELKIALIENGSSWVAPLLDQLADVYKKMPEQFLGNPVEAIKNSIHVSPFYEEDLGGLVDLMGVDRILFGSDYPHPEGLAQPTSYVEAIQGLSITDQAKIMGGNLSRLIPA